MIRVQPDTAGIAQAVEALRSGEVVLYPTETVYGLAVDPFNAQAVEKLFKVKGRDADKPVLLIVGNVGQLDTIVSEISPHAKVCMDAFWPGPLTLLLPKTDAVPDSITAGSSKVGVRSPGLDVARALCNTFGGALTSTSANLSGEAPAVSLDGLDLSGVALAIDGGRLDAATPSTLYDPESRVVLREGAISLEMLVERTR